MKEYLVTFYKRELNKKTEEIEPNKLGAVRIDDSGVNRDLPLITKAFRHVSGKICEAADEYDIARVA